MTVLSTIRYDARSELGMHIYGQNYTLKDPLMRDLGFTSFTVVAAFSGVNHST